MTMMMMMMMMMMPLLPLPPLLLLHLLLTLLLLPPTSTPQEWKKVEEKLRTCAAKAKAEAASVESLLNALKTRVKKQEAEQQSAQARQVRLCGLPWFAISGAALTLFPSLSLSLSLFSSTNQ